MHHVLFSPAPFSHSLSLSVFASLLVVCRSFPLIISLCHRLSRIAFRGQFNRSCAVGCAKWSCVPGDKWDTWFLRSGISPRSNEFIHSRVRPIGLAETTWFVHVCMYKQHIQAPSEGPRSFDGDDAGPRASYRIAQSVAATAWNYNGCGDVTTLGCTMLSALYRRRSLGSK